MIGTVSSSTAYRYRSAIVLLPRDAVASAEDTRIGSDNLLRYTFTELFRLTSRLLGLLVFSC